MPRFDVPTKMDDRDVLDGDRKPLRQPLRRFGQLHVPLSQSPLFRRKYMFYGERHMMDLVIPGHIYVSPRCPGEEPGEVVLLRTVAPNVGRVRLAPDFFEHPVENGLRWSQQDDTSVDASTLPERIRHIVLSSEHHGAADEVAVDAAAAASHHRSRRLQVEELDRRLQEHNVDVEEKHLVVLNERPSCKLREDAVEGSAFDRVEFLHSINVVNFVKDPHLRKELEVVWGQVIRVNQDSVNRILFGSQFFESLPENPSTESVASTSTPKSARICVSQWSHRCSLCHLRRIHRLCRIL
mmetsp:Transcript_16187/g.35045  ORF Transcript_16187/g.35045 Transcript_16187/m.35045 type:complete len:296 (-) Transcript_16187:664-1551(-)